jgi:hypothetical protein
VAPCKKSGIKNDVALLTRWTVEWGFDAPLETETPLEPETFRNTALSRQARAGTI